ncbi:MAG: HlyC/CorC family transporter [Phycisphaeraceae bacterium]|nr:HlyC/CorC family transporter [Phycisphaeraceae bacterium]
MLTALVIVTAISLVGSFLCSLCEAALYSVSDSAVAGMLQQKVRGARILAKLRVRIDRAIAAILAVNTIANTVGASVAGFLVGKLYGSTALGVFSAAFTLSILFVAEIIPKSIGVARATSIAPRVAWIIELMILITYPLVILCERLTTIINRGAKKEGPTEHEILSLTRMAVRLGSLEPHEAALVSNALELDEYEVREIMTPRSVTFVLPDELKLKNVDQHAQHWIHSRLPVVRDDNPNEIVGVVHRRDVFDLLVSEREGEKKIRDVMRPVRFIGASAGADEALREFLAGRQHMFVVVDEYGTWVGIVTLEDVLETLLGSEIIGEHDPVADMQDLALQKAAEQGIEVDDPDDDDESEETEDWSDPARWAETLERRDEREERQERQDEAEIERRKRAAADRRAQDDAPPPEVDVPQREDRDPAEERR